MKYSVDDIRRFSARQGNYSHQHRRAFTRAVAAMAFAGCRGSAAQEVLKGLWRDDDQAGLILRAVSDPLETSSFPAIQTNVVLPMLAPAAASTKLLGMGAQLNLEGIATVRLPYVGGAGRPASPAFVGEGAPAPAVNLLTRGAILGPACKIVILSGISAELQAASAETAEEIVSRALVISCEQAIDAALFSSAPATAIQPAGLLHGITPMTSTGGTGASGMADDLALLAEAIGANGISTDDLVFIATPILATKVRVLAGPKFQDAVMSSAMLSAGTVIGIVPRGLAVGYVGAVEVETSNAATIHFEDTAPLPIVDSSGTLAAPTSSAFQQNLIILKIRARCAWCVQPGAVAVVEAADW
jgi:hypothetical protein